jgi:hypothetical protein
MPIWIANGTEIGTGGRLLTVPFAPRDWPFHAARDALFALNGDVSISTAINNTARFPYLEPSGELLALPDPNRPPRFGEQFHILRGDAQEIVDGGYFENEGLQTALELAFWLRTTGRALVGGRLVEPIIVQATAGGDRDVADKDVVRCGSGGADDPTARSPVKPPLQLLAPVFGLYNVRGGHSAVELRVAKLGSLRQWLLPFLSARPGGNRLGREEGRAAQLAAVGRHDGAYSPGDDRDAGNARESDRLAKALKQPWPPVP